MSAPTDCWFTFDDFIVSTADPRAIAFSGLQAGMRVEVWDNLGNLLASGVATGSVLHLSVVGDAVAGTGANGRIVVRYPDGSLCVEHLVLPHDAILGGDAYKLELG